MRAEGLPAVEAEEGRLARVVDQVVLQPDRNLDLFLFQRWIYFLRKLLDEKSNFVPNLEGSVAFWADLVFGVSLVVGEVAEPVEHDLVSPTKLPGGIC